MTEQKALAVSKSDLSSAQGGMLKAAKQKKSCNHCIACRTLKAKPLQSPDAAIDVLRTHGVSLAAHRKCITGFLQEHYGSQFAKSVVTGLSNPATTRRLNSNATPQIKPKKISRAHTSAAVGKKPFREMSETKGRGKPLDYQTRSFMGSKIGVDFRDVRVHTDSHAEKSAKDLSAKAFTMGRDIYFASGKYRPESREGKHLLAHELAHVAQSKGSTGNDKSASHVSDIRSRASHIISLPHEATELHASKVAVATVASSEMPVPVPSIRSKPRTIQREAEDKEDAWPISTIKGWIASRAEEIPGLGLVTFLIGKNPITGQSVERTAKGFFGGLLGLIPGGESILKSLEEAKTLESAFAWASEQIQALNITWESMKALVKTAWDRAYWPKGPEWNLKMIAEVFAPTYQKLKSFATQAVQKIYFFVFEGVLKMLGAPVERVMSFLKKAGETIDRIVSDPIGFLKNLLAALSKGFNQFSANIWEHLKTGLMGWLFGALSDIGVTIPKTFDAKSIFGLVMDILGFTKEYLRKKAAKVIGEKNLELIEKAWSFISTLISTSIGGLWDTIKEYIGNLPEMVVGAIQDWVVTKIVTSAVLKLATMFNPVGAIITAIQTIYNTVMFLIERMNQIMALVEAIFESVASIAKGSIGEAANWIEQMMARTLPVIISFLARLIGLGGISETIKKLILKLREKIDKAIDKVIVVVVRKVKGLFAKLTTEKDPAKAERNKQIVIRKLTEKLRKGIKGFKLRAYMVYLKLRYRIKVLKMDKSNPEEIKIIIENSKKQKLKAKTNDCKKVEEKDAGKTADNGAETKGCGPTIVDCLKNCETPLGAVRRVFGTKYKIHEDKFLVKEDKWHKPSAVSGVTGSKTHPSSERGNEPEVQASGHIGADEVLVKTGQKINYDGGHLIGYRFFGDEANKSWNVSPQDPVLNKSAYSRAEKLIADSPVHPTIKGPQRHIPIKINVSVDYEESTFSVDSETLQKNGIIDPLDPESPHGDNRQEEVAIPTRVPKCWTITAEVQDSTGEYTLATVEMENKKTGIFRNRFNKDKKDVKDFTWYMEGYLPSKGSKEPVCKGEGKDTPATAGKIGGKKEATFKFTQFPVKIKGKAN